MQSALLHINVNAKLRSMRVQVEMEFGTTSSFGQMRAFHNIDPELVSARFHGHICI